MTVQERPLLLGEYQLEVEEFPPSPEGTALVFARLAAELGRASKSSIATGEARIFAIPAFLAVVDSAIKAGRPHIDVVFYSTVLENFVRQAQDRGLERVPDEAWVGFLDDLRSRYGQESTSGTHIRDVVDKAVRQDILNLFVLPERYPGPHTVVIDRRKVFIQQRHAPEEFGVSKGWFVLNPRYLLTWALKVQKDLYAKSVKLIPPASVPDSTPTGT